MKIPCLPVPENIPNILSSGQVVEVIKAIKEPMYKTIAILLYSSELRVSEAVRLRISDVRHNTMQLYIENSKRRKSRYAILSQTALLALEKYYRQFRPANYFFESLILQNMPISVECVQKRLKAASMELNLKCTPHTFSLFCDTSFGKWDKRTIPAHFNGS